MDKNVSVICLSGGIDSATVLGLVKDLSPLSDAEIVTVSFIYPSKHNCLELEAAKSVAMYYSVKHHIIDMTSFFATLKNNSLIGDTDIPEGYYTDKTMASTIVPLRNTIFTMCACSWALDTFKDAKQICIYLGVHTGDHHIYPDCKPLSLSLMDGLAKSSGSERLTVLAPFLMYDKADILFTGNVLGVPYVLTRTCYTDGANACGKCGSCVERLEAFKTVGVKDPIKYVL